MNKKNSLLFLLTVFPLFSYDPFSFPEKFDIFFLEEDFSPKMLNSDSMQQFLEPVNFRQAECLSDYDIVTLLLRLNAPIVLQNDLYKFSNPPNIIDLHSLPSLQPHFDRSCNWAIAGQFFANTTPKMFFTPCSPFIDSYLALGNGDFIEQIDTSLLPDIDIPEIISLFSSIKLQERRIGAMLSAFKRYKCWNFTAILPVYYLEHNFFLTDEEIDAISINPVFRQIPAGTDKTATEQMIACHLVNDAAGIGDLRLTVDYDLSEIFKADALIGFDFISPTAKAIKRGIIGNCFAKNAPIPNFDLRELFCTEDNTKILNESLDFLVGALDRLTTNVGESSLGQKGFSLRPFIEYKKPFTERLSLVTYGQVQYNFTYKDIRFFIARTNPQGFDRDWENPEFATENLNFLNQAFIDTLYAFPLCIKIRPGIAVRLAASLQWESKDFSVAFGYDFWHRDAEKVIKLPPQATENFIISKGLQFSAHQHKIFAHIFAHHDHNGCDTWHIGLRTDITLTSKGIGRCYTAAVDFIYDF